MERVSNQALRFAENLTLPTVQVIVMKGSTGCGSRRSRVSQLVTRMNEGLLDYAVDLRRKEVVVRGVVDVKRGSSSPPPPRLGHAGGMKKLSGFFGSFRCIICSGGM
ncbi:unnamed protein product [Spirodela intermedia]|uniref:Uncharacterized protein n=1 Tax=Spirodela intermedia TaxID=51605 RepID=A0A7I8KF79_SPIIN|nr:unnamed protein product [Spirodela intermedia]